MLDKFMQDGNVYRGPRYDFLLLKDFIEFVRKIQLDVKVRDVKQILVDSELIPKKVSVSTTEGFQSKDVWILPKRLEYPTKNIPVEATKRKNLIAAEEEEAERIIKKMFEYDLSNEMFSEVFITKNEIIFSNKGLKQLLEKMKITGSITRLAAVIRKKAKRILVGERFFGISSRTVLFKNYYRIEKK